MLGTISLIFLNIFIQFVDILLADAQCEKPVNGLDSRRAVPFSTLFSERRPSRPFGRRHRLEEPAMKISIYCPVCGALSDVDSSAPQDQYRPDRWVCAICGNEAQILTAPSGSQYPMSTRKLPNKDGAAEPENR
jgi:hypothetical protein